MNVIEKLQDKEYQIDLVTEFFDSKYTREQVEDYLYTQVKGDDGTDIRKGVKVLADEFVDDFGMGEIQVDEENDEKVRGWYESTDFYVFDLLPWNTCNMFKDKLKYTTDMLKKLQSKSIVDFGGGLGIVSIILAETGDYDKITYVDLKGGVTYGFAEFLIKKLGLQDKIQMMGDKEFFESDDFVDCVISNDCFEHIVDLEGTIDELVKKTNTILHDSTFQTDMNTPQHIHGGGDKFFADMMLKRYFGVVNGDVRCMKRITLIYGQDGRIQMGIR